MNYAAVILYNGKYYLSHKYGKNQKFQFNELSDSTNAKFKNKNIYLRKKIASDLQDNTVFSNTDTNNIHRYVRLLKIPIIQKNKTPKLTFKNIAVFTCDKMEPQKKSIEVPFTNDMIDHSDKDSVSIIRQLKIRKNIITCILYIMLFLCFFTLGLESYFLDKESNVFKLNCISSLFVVLNYVTKFFTWILLLNKKIYKKIYSYLLKKDLIFLFDDLADVFHILISIALTWLLTSFLDFNKFNDLMSVLGASFICLDAFIHKANN